MVSSYYKMQKQCHGNYKLFLPLVVSIQANPPSLKMRRYYMAGNDRHRKIKKCKVSDTYKYKCTKNRKQKLHLMRISRVSY